MLKNSFISFSDLQDWVSKIFLIISLSHFCKYKPYTLFSLLKVPFISEGQTNLGSPIS